MLMQRVTINVQLTFEGFIEAILKKWREKVQVTSRLPLFSFWHDGMEPTCDDELGDGLMGPCWLVDNCL